MKKIVLLLALFTISIFELSAQKKFRKVTAEDFAKTYEIADSTTDAVYIYSIGESEFCYAAQHFMLRTHVKARLKILTEEGREHANCSVTYSYSKDRSGFRNDNIRNISATSYNLVDGKVTSTELSNKYIFHENISDRLRKTKFSIPDVKVGSIIEYEFTLESPNYGVLPTWKVQLDEPVLYSYYDITIPEWFTCDVECRGSQTINVKKELAHLKLNTGYSVFDVASNRYIAEAENLPSFKKENYVICADDYNTHIDFEVSGIQIPGDVYKSFAYTWNDVRELLKTNYGYNSCLKTKNPYAEEMKSLQLDGLTSVQKASKLFSFIHSKLKWDKTYRLSCNSLSKVVKEGNGSNVELNFIYMSMLREAGINCTPLLIRLRDEGRLPMTHPSIDKLSTFVVAFVDEKKDLFFADCSAEYGDINVLPAKLMTGGVLFDPTIAADMPQTVDLKYLVNNGCTNIIQGILSEDGKFVGSCKSTYFGCDALEFKKGYHNATDSAAFIQEIEKFYDCTIKSVKLRNTEGTGNKTTIQFLCEKDIRNVNDRMYLNPMMFVDLKNSPFTKDNRKLPVEYSYARTIKYITDIAIPDDYVVESMPENETYSLGEDCHLSFNVVLDGQKIRTTYTFDNMTTFIGLERYKELQEFYNKLVKTNSKLVVLKKK